MQTENKLDEVTLYYDFIPNEGTQVIEENGKTTIRGRDVSFVLPPKMAFDIENGRDGNPYCKATNITMHDGGKIGEYYDLIPPGIINKRITGIGATTAELRSKRNSIIVVPTKSLALNKHKQYPHSLYVGSTIEDCITSPTDEEIAAYIDRTDIDKKILVVADSLPRILDAIRKERYPEYFYMIDEIDTIQMDSYFRPKLEYVSDYYFEFPKEKRAMVSATIKPSSHPGLEKEGETNYGYETMPQKNCSLVYTDDTDLALKEQLEFLVKTTKRKIVVAYNSPKRIMQIIRSLRRNIQKQCTVLCGENNKGEMSFYNKRTGEEDVYYRELTGTSLETRITFITSAYFVGLDIIEPFHLVSVANADKSYTLLSLEKMIQIAGRCRIPQGILSDTMIYSIRKNKKIDIEEYTQYLHKEAEKMLDFYRLAEKYLSDSQLVEMIKANTQHLAQERLPGEPDFVLLIRRDIHGNYVKSYNNIDALIERQILVNQLYSSPEQLKEHLEATPDVNITYSEKLYDGAQSLPVNTAEEINESKELLEQKELEEVVIPALEAGKKINPKDLRRRRSRNFLDTYWNLIPYMNKEELIEKLTEESTDPRRLRNYRNSVKFWALAIAHPFKVSIFSAFKKGEIYTRKEIHTKLCECFRTNGLRPPGDAEKSVQLLSIFFIHTRVNTRTSQHRIMGKYSYRINYGTLHKKVINSKLPLLEVFVF